MPEIDAARRQALYVARRLTRYVQCRRSKVGAVILRDGRIVSTGMNGKVGRESCTDGGCPRGLLDYEQAPLGTPSAGTAKCVGICAERVAILDAARRGIALEGTTLVVTKTPCRTCRMHIELAGIIEVIIVSEG